MSDILAKQHKFLKEYINEAEKNEEKRIRRLQNCSKGEKTHLLQRFETERNADKQKIEILSKDLMQLKSVHVAGGLEEFKSQRTASRERVAMSGKGIESEKNASRANRFAGLETFDQKLFFKDVVNKFDRDAKNFEKTAQNLRFDPRAEYQQLKLLTEKRDLIKKLINVQCAPEMNSVTSSRAGSRGNGGGSSHFNSMSSMSSLSYATFSSPAAKNYKQSNNHSVPRLNL